jgi:predicted transcriptional regulator
MPATKKGTKDTIATSVRVTPLGRAIWDKLAEKMGLSATGVLETALRRMAKDEGFSLEEIEAGLKTTE